MNIIVLGSGVREAALAKKLSQSPQCQELFCIPGNGGTSGFATNVAGIDPCDAAQVVPFAREHGVELGARQCQRLLREMGFSLVRPQRVPPGREGLEAEREAFKKTL